MEVSALSSSQTATRSPKVLIPYDVREAISVASAARNAGKSETTIRTWCRRSHIGRRIGGSWAVSRVALAMLIEDDMDALANYLDGARAQYDPVSSYYRRLGLGELLKRLEFGGGQEESPQLPQSPEMERPCGSASAPDPHGDCPPDDRAPNPEGSGRVEPNKMNPDTIVSLVADDPEVKKAVARWDRATPSTHYDLARARDEAQARKGIPVANRAFLFSAEVDDCLLPIVGVMWPGDEVATLQTLRRDFDERYGDLGPRVLAFCLRTFRHSNIEGLKRAAGVE